MRERTPLFKTSLVGLAAVGLLIPGSAARADDVDLFRQAIPPNILLYVDNSSSMLNQVYHRDWSGRHEYVKASGVTATRKNKSQKECYYFRNLPSDTGTKPYARLGIDSFKIYNSIKSESYKNLKHVHGGDEHNQPAYAIAEDNANFESFHRWPVYIGNDENGTQIHAWKDVDQDGEKDVSEPYYYHWIPDPTETGDWASDTALGTEDAIAVEDWDGTHLYYDENGNGTYDGDDVYLYYRIKSNGKPKGSAFNMKGYIKPIFSAMASGMNPVTLRWSAGSTICGKDASGFSLFDKDDPNAGTRSGQVVTIKAQYLDFLFSDPGATARAETFAVERDYTLAPATAAAALPVEGRRQKAACITKIQVNGVEEPDYYWTYRRSRTQALQLILRQIVCRVNEETDTGVRFGFAQFRYHGKGGDDNGAYVAVPVMDWYSDRATGTQTTYTLHGEELTHEEHLLKVFTHTTPDAQTPLVEGLFQLYTYFMPRTAADMPYGRDSSGLERELVVDPDTGDEVSAAYKFPVYNYDMSLYDPFNETIGTLWDGANDPQSSLLLVGGLFAGVNPDSYSEDANLPTGTDFDGFAAPDPVQNECQKHFVLLITDGGSAGDDFTDRDEDILAAFGTANNLPASFDTGTDRGYDIFMNLIGDHFRAPDGTADETKDEGNTGSSNLLDDVALYMNRYDFRPDIDEIQTIDTYTVGYSLESATGVDIDEDPLAVLTGSALERAAIRGNGRYFESADADKLENDLVKAITEMIEKAQAFTSATVPASRTTDGNHFYSSYFMPSNDSGYWEGHLKSFEFTAAGDILDKFGYCATGGSGNVAPNPTCEEGGSFDLFADGFWDAADEIPAPGSRALYVQLATDMQFSKPSSFTRSLDPAVFGIEVGLGDADGDGGEDGDDGQEPYLGTGMTTAEEIRDALINVTRGCEFNTDCEPRMNDENTHKVYFGDIFHSNPVVIGSPNSPVNEASYHTFANTYRQRDRIIYAGANDGFLHGIHAGSWQTKVRNPDGTLSDEDLLVPKHDAGTGEEVMGFMPAAIRDVIKELPKQGGSRTMETVDAPPVAADVWMYRAVSGGLPQGSRIPNATMADKVAGQWRTILMGGLRDGGRSYYALDVTTPTGTAAATAASSAYPLTLWNFPCEGNSAACTGSATLGGSLKWADFMGYTWSEPVITRIKVQLSAGGSPAGHERWVAIFGGGYDPQSDPNHKPTSADTSDDYQPVALRGRAIFMVDITTGEVLAMKGFSDNDVSIGGTQIAYDEMKYAFASAPAVFDLNFDGYADVIYIGDLGGNVWKWVITAKGDDPINDANGNIAQPNWPFRLFFAAQPSGVAAERTAPPGAYDPTVHYQSFFFPPTGGLVNHHLHLAFGAGERQNPKGLDSQFGDGDPSNNNRYYIVRDDDPLDQVPVPEADGTSRPYHSIDDQFTDADLADIDTHSYATCAALRAAKVGYYLVGRDAEKFITNSVVFLGEVVTGSYIPPNPADDSAICSASGDGWMYRFSLDCGVGEFGAAGDTTSDRRRSSVGGGIPTRPRVSVGDLNQGDSSDGVDCKNKVVMITSDGAISNDCPGVIEGAGIEVRSWRQR